MAKTFRKQDIADDYAQRFPKGRTAPIARRMHNENPGVWPNQNAASLALRRARGRQGVASRKIMPPVVESPDHDSAPFAKLPDGLHTLEDSTPVEVNASRVLVLGDVHLPYHEKNILELAVREAKRFKVDCVILNGDIVDFYAISRWQTDPRARDFSAEVNLAREFFVMLRDAFPGAQIIYKIGNHEERYDIYMQSKAPEMLGIDDFVFENILRLPRLRIKTFDRLRHLQLGKLAIVHGHEFANGIYSPVNPARGLYLKAKTTAMCGHAHQESKHSERALDGREIGTWSVGCCCDLKPRYMPNNSWTHGFALIECYKSLFAVQNKRVIDGVCV
ncbi:MAG: metallophosphoesterase [Verrucomicrobiota bacterium]